LNKQILKGVTKMTNKEIKNLKKQFGVNELAVHEITSEMIDLLEQVSNEEREKMLEEIMRGGYRV